MDAKHSQPQRIVFLLSLAAVLCFLTLYGLAVSNAQEQKVWVVIYTYSVCNSTDPRDASQLWNVAVQLNSQTYQISPTTNSIDAGYISTGTYQVRASAPDRPNAKLAFAAYSETGLSGSKQYRSDNSGVVTFNLGNGGVLQVYLDDCPATKQTKAFRLFAISEEGCKELQGTNAVFSLNGSETRFPLEGLKDGDDTSLEAGTYEVRIVPINPGPIQAELLKVRVSQKFKSSWKQLEFPADESGKAKVNLEKGMWTGDSAPEIEVYVAGLCGEVGYIDSKQGDAWIAAPNSTSRQATYRAPVHVGETIRTSAGGSIDLKTYNGYLIKIGEKTKLRVGLAKTATGIRYLERLIELEMGNIQIIRLVNDAPSKSNYQPSPEPTGISVKTPTATINDKETNYTVNYDENSKVTTVGVEEGKVEVTPANSSLQPITLAASQQILVTESNVGSITAYTPNGGGGKTGWILLYVGIGVASLLALTALLFFIRRQHRLAMQPAFYPASMNPAGWNTPPTNVASPVVDNASPKCPNPQCGRTALVGKEFCAFCGTRLKQK